jgi:hypothetical protein
MNLLRVDIYNNLLHRHHPASASLMPVVHVPGPNVLQSNLRARPLLPSSLSVVSGTPDVIDLPHPAYSLTLMGRASYDRSD